MSLSYNNGRTLSSKKKSERALSMKLAQGRQRRLVIWVGFGCQHVQQE